MRAPPSGALVAVGSHRAPPTAQITHGSVQTETGSGSKALITRSRNDRASQSEGGSIAARRGCRKPSEIVLVDTGSPTRGRRRTPATSGRRTQASNDDDPQKTYPQSALVFVAKYVHYPMTL
jgi:hypothetical protein